MTRSLLTVMAALLLFAVPAAAQQSDGVRAETGVERVHNELGLLGTGAIVAVLDRGIDYEHPDFRNPDGTTRLLYIFDTLDNTGASDPDNPTGFGTVYTRDEINAALAAGVRLNTRDAVGHGTASMGIAAGNGAASDGFYAGMAPGADLIAVKLITEGAPAHDGEPAEAPNPSPGNRLFPAIDFVLARATEAGKPVVFLANFGSSAGPMDGTSTDARGIDARFGSGFPGRVFITGSSDDGGVANHAGGTVQQGQSLDLRISKAASFLRLDLWYGADDRFTVEVVAPNGTVYGPFAPPPNGVQSSGSGPGFALFHNGDGVDFYGASSPSRELLIDFNGTAGTYTVRLTGTTVVDGSFNASLNPSNIIGAPPQNRFTTFAVPGYTVWDLASARQNLCPNSYVLNDTWVDIDGITRTYPGNEGGPGTLWTGSGIGPTYDGRLGITVSAPGNSNITPYAPRSFFNTFRFNVIEDGPAPYGILAAVSGAAPVVSGIVALLLEANPTLDAAQVKDVLQRTARADAFTGAVPNPAWGYGKIDAFAAASDVLGTTATAPGATPEGFGLTLAGPNPFRRTTALTLTLPAPQSVRVEAFDVLGRRVAVLHDGAMAAGPHPLTLDASELPAGLYVVRATGSEATRGGAVVSRSVTVVR